MMIIILGYFGRRPQGFSSYSIPGNCTSDFARCYVLQLTTFAIVEFVTGLRPKHALRSSIRGDLRDNVMVVMRRGSSSNRSAFTPMLRKQNVSSDATPQLRRGDLVVRRGAML